MAELSDDKKILLKGIDEADLHTLAVYQRRGGYDALKKALSSSCKKVLEDVTNSGLRGRGGAGFPTGMKWGFLPKDRKKPVYLICNADESEPGTFKDRVILEKNPHLVIEGVVIAAYTIQSHKAYLYIRGEYAHIAKILDTAIKEAYQTGLLGKNILGSGFDLELVLHQGAGAYICGEETGLISSLEGKKGQPKLKPPFPAVSGYLGCPTIINNVETLANIPWIVTHGGSAFAEYGTEKSKGTRLFCLSGWVNRPGVYEEELGYPLIEMIQKQGGGARDGAKIKAVIPGGSSSAPLTLEEVKKVRLDFEDMMAHQSALGSAGIIVIPEHYCLLKLLDALTEFYWDESCGQCTPCREGTGWLHKMVAAIERGDGREQDIDNLLKTTKSMMGTTICALSDAAAMPVIGYIRKFREEFEAHIKSKGCPYEK